MNPHQDRSRLRLVFSRNRPSAPACQQSLFPQPKPGVVVFLHCLNVAGTQFVDAIRLSQPSRIFDLRFAPRFDLGSLNRSSAFKLFEEVNAAYVDAAAHFMLGKPRETAVDQLRDELATADPQRSVLFLFGSDKTSLLSEHEILDLLAAAGKPAADLVFVPPEGA